MIHCPAPRIRAKQRSNTGCWTCRVRRKKCDETRPACGTCAYARKLFPFTDINDGIGTTLGLSCSGYDAKPSWMDGKDLEKHKAQEIKAVVARQKRSRRQRSSVTSSDSISHNIPSGPMLSPRASTERELSHTPQNFEVPSISTEFSLVNWASSDPSSVPIETPSSTLGLQANTPSLLTPFEEPSTTVGLIPGIITNLDFTAAVGHDTSSSHQETVQQRVQDINLALCSTSYDDIFANHSLVVDEIYQSFILQYYVDEIFSIQTPYLGREESQAMDSILTRLWAYSQTVRRVISTCVHDHRQLACCSSGLGNPSETVPSLFQHRHQDADESGILLALCSARDDDEASCLALILFLEARSGRGWSSAAAGIMENWLQKKEDHLQQNGTTSLKWTVLNTLHTFAATFSRNEMPKVTALSTKDLGPNHVNCVLGCQSWVLDCINEINQMRFEKSSQQMTGAWSVLQMAQRASKLQFIIEEQLTRVSTRLATASTRSVLHTLQLTSIYGGAALVLLHSVTSGPHPNVIEVQTAVDATIQSIKTLEHPKLLAHIAWPLCISGCLAQPQHERFLNKIARGLEHNVSGVAASRALQVATECQRLRSQAHEPGVSVDWTDALESLGRQGIII